MRRIINQTTTRVYKDGRLYDKTDTDTIEVPDPTPTPAPVRTLTTNAQTCGWCRQAHTACRCHTPQPHTQAQENGEDWMPLSIMNARATVANPAALDPILNEYGYMVARQPASIPAPVTDKQSAPVTMSAEEHALRTQEVEWWDLYSKCTSYLTCLVPDTQLRNCTAQQLAALYGQLQAGLTIKEWRNEALEAWMPKGILTPSKP